MDGQKDFFSVYFAGELFTYKDLAGNAMLAEAIYARSGGGFRCALPQNFEQRKSRPKGIRDEDILSLLECDLALFNYDGQELDSGTVVEFMFAKFADIPALVVRSDFRGIRGGRGRRLRSAAAAVEPHGLLLSAHRNPADRLRQALQGFYSRILRPGGLHILVVVERL